MSTLIGSLFSKLLVQPLHFVQGSECRAAADGVAPLLLRAKTSRNRQKLAGAEVYLANILPQSPKRSRHWSTPAHDRWRANAVRFRFRLRPDHGPPFVFDALRRHTSPREHAADQATPSSSLQSTCTNNSRNLYSNEFGRISRSARPLWPQHNIDAHVRGRRPRQSTACRARKCRTTCCIQRVCQPPFQNGH